MIRCLILALAACSAPVATGNPPTSGTPTTGTPTTGTPPAPSTGLAERWKTHTKDETGPGMCAAKGVDKTCTADADCSMVDEILDECQTTGHLGVNARGRAAFEARPKLDPCDGKPCPKCFVHWSFAEDCVVSEQPIVACTKGQCMTHAPEK